jgi:hypothetical protein
VYEYLRLYCVSNKREKDSYVHPLSLFIR